MKRYVMRTLSGAIHPIMGTLGSRFTFLTARRKINKLFTIATILFFISPIFFLMYLVLIFFRYYSTIHEVFFFSKEATGIYAQMLRPATSGTMATAVGYRVYPEELEDHLRIVSSDEKAEMKELGLKGKQMRGLSYRQFGFNIDRLCRHNVFLGTTGSGKTETIMSLFVDIVKCYSGLGLVDGKSDQAMEYKIYNLCKENYYETQFSAIVLNKPELNTESNTYSPLLSYQSATKLSEFLGDFLGGGESSGNGDYFANRGKVMLGNIVMYFKNRQLYYGENFSINDLSGSVQVTEINSIYFMSYAIISELEFMITEAIERDSSFKKMINKARLTKTTQNEEIKNSEVLSEYLNQNSHLTRRVEKILGIKYNFFANHYELFVSLDSYIHGVFPTWGKYARNIARVLFAYAKKEKINFLYTHSSPAKITYMRSTYNKLKDLNSEETKVADTLPSMTDIDAKELGIPLAVKVTSVYYGIFKEAMGLADTAETIENMSTDALQQHSYSEQQWSRVFGLYKQYLRVFGTPSPDVDGEDLLKNNKVLYVMLPVMELSPDQVDMLGKMFILMFKMIASIALGGDKQSATPIQFKIYQNKIKPNPIYLMVLDELGSYMPSSSLSTILSQVRSLRIGMMLSVQDTVSMNPQSNQNELKRITANLNKIILQHKDTDTKDLESIIPEIEIIDSEGHIKAATSDNLLESGRLKVDKQKSIDLGLATRFAKGMGMYIDGGRREPIFFQSYYLGDNARQAVQIRRFESFDSLRSE